MLKKGLFFALCLGLLPATAHAYKISTLLGSGCHEKITTEALRAVRLDLSTAAPLPLTSNEQALVDDLEFTPELDMKDLGGVSLLVGARDNDLKGRASDDLTELAYVHGDPNTTDEHCIRNREQDEPNGSEEALVDCRAFIRGRVLEALEGLDVNSVPDLAKRTLLPLHLSLRGGIDASLPTYYVRIGQAMHALQDGFTHTYRTADGLQVTVVMNWIDFVEGHLSESRDGPAHADKMDVCDDPDELRATRRTLATEASNALLRVTLDPQTTKDEKMTAVDGLLDKYLSYSPGCTFDNNWCDAPERDYKDQNSTPFGCTAGEGGVLGGLLGLIVLTLFSLRRKTISAVVTVAIIGSALSLAGISARADEATTPPPPTTVPVKEPGPKDPSKAAWGAYFGTSGSVDKPAFAGQLGIRRRVSTHWTFGWDAEWNPWVSLNGPTPVRAGVFNTFGTVILRFPLAYENFNLRSTVNLGTSILLIDLYGASKGSIGINGAISPLGIEWKLSRMFHLIINPLNLAIPVPQIQGVPLTYPQYRFSIGLEILAG